MEPMFWKCKLCWVYNVSHTSHKTCFFNLSIWGTSLYFRGSHKYWLYFFRIFSLCIRCLIGPISCFDVLWPSLISIICQKGFKQPSNNLCNTSPTNRDSPGERQKVICCVIGIDQQPHHPLQICNGHFLLWGRISCTHCPFNTQFTQQLTWNH